MKVVEIIGGLGAQITQYMFFLDIKQRATDEEILIDTSAFDYLNIWNGYELERLFGIKETDIRQTIKLKQDRVTENWRKDNLHYCFRNINKEVWYYYKGKRHKWIQKNEDKYMKRENVGMMFRLFSKIQWYINYVIKNRMYFIRKHQLRDEFPSNYLEQPGVTFYFDVCFMSDKFLLKDRGELRSIFRFPEFDSKNRALSDKMCVTDSIAIHIRRGDHMYDNGRLFSNGYFKKAVSYMKANLKNPVFYIFSEDTGWCKNNLFELGVDSSDDFVMVDWNTGTENYRDMQLMTYCKNNILVMSSFSWCGYYLSVHQEKIVIAPEGCWLEVPIHM